MNDTSSDAGCQQGDGNPPKKSKKTKRKTCDSVSCEDPSNVKDGSVCEIEADVVLIKAKKHKKKRKELYCEEDSAAQIEEAGEVLREVIKRKKKKISHLEKKTAIQTESVEIPEEPDEERVIKKRKKKKKSAKDDIGEEVFDVGVEVNDKHGDSSKKKKKQKSTGDSCVEEHLVDGDKVEKGNVDNSVLKKKKKKRKLFFDEEDCDVTTTEKEEVFHGISLKKRKKKHILNDSGNDSVVQVEEEFLAPKNKKRKLATNVSDEQSIDSAVVKDSQETQRRHCSKDTNNFSENSSVYLKQSLQTKEMKQGCVNNPYVWIRPGITRPVTPGLGTTRAKWGQEQNQKTLPRYLKKPPLHVEGWHSSMVFKFDNHPKVRHYIPKKLMAMNEIKQQLGEMDEVYLKIPKILFKGSSLYDIPGYGYGTPD